MKIYLLKASSIVFVLSIISLLFSCDKDNNDSQSLIGTVWIHQYTPEDNIIDGAAAALYFGKEKVEYYALDENLKVLRLIKSFNYQIRGQIIVIGIKESTLSDNSLYFNNLIYYRSDKKITDMLIH